MKADEQLMETKQETAKELYSKQAGINLYAGGFK